MTKKIITGVAAVSYESSDGFHRIGQLGDEIDVSADEAKRLEALGAFEPDTGEDAPPVEEQKQPSTSSSSGSKSSSSNGSSSSDTSGSSKS